MLPSASSQTSLALSPQSLILAELFVGIVHNKLSEISNETLQCFGKIVSGHSIGTLNQFQDIAMDHGNSIQLNNCASNNR